MAALASRQHQPMTSPRDDVMDTRTPSPVLPADSPDSKSQEAAYKPDLSAEVAMLSTKLVNAINYQTNLDDSLQQTRLELEQQQQRCTTIEEEKMRVDQLITSGALVKKSETDRIILKLRQELESERTAREIAEKDKKKVEGELENLTTALFEEANSMVAAARKDTEAVEKRNAQLRSQLQDTEMLLASQQEQLQDLKATMEKQDEATMSRVPSMPSTPITNQGAAFDALQISPNDSSLPELLPEHPLHFAQLISPVLRSDISAYADFQDLLLLARRLGAHSRTTSSTATHSASGGSISTNQLASTSSPNLPGAFSFSANSSPSSNFAGSSTLPPLKDSKFYKRVLAEDIEPCMRLDLAPGLSFLSRRTVVGALLQGTLAVEPYPQNKHYFACTLCGESRRNEPYVRKYRFRTSEDDAVPKPLCDYCVARLRSTCDFVGFLRMIRDGHWKCDSEEDQKSAWEESVRLRERMFWTRLGGGVVPSQQLRTVPPTPSSVAARHSLESIPEAVNQPVEAAGGKNGTPDVFQGQPERPKSAIGSALVGMSSGAATSPVPELRAEERSKFVTPPASRGVDTDRETQSPAAAEAGAVDTDPGTPFEDANQQLESELEASAGVTDEPVAVDKPDDTMSKLETINASSEEDMTPSLVNSLHELSVGEEAATAQTSLHMPTSEPEAPPRTSLTVEQRPEPERRGSAVLARVRAMESQGKSLPGAFE